MSKKRGRPTLPKKIKERRGTYNKTRHDKSQGDPKGSKMKKISHAPEYLNDGAKEKFDFLYEKLNNIEILRAEDLTGLATLATINHDLTRIIEKCNTADFLVKGSKGNMVQNPIFLLRSRMIKESLELSSKYGITPSGRAALKIPALEGEAAPSSPDSEFNDV